MNVAAHICTDWPMVSPFLLHIFISLFWTKNKALEQIKTNNTQLRILWIQWLLGEQELSRRRRGTVILLHLEQNKIKFINHETLFLNLAGLQSPTKGNQG